MSYEAKPVWFLNPSESTPQIRSAIESFLQSWIPKHSIDGDLQLYHYTTADGLKGIINNRCIWFTHTSILNDPSELKYGKELISKELRKAIAKQSDGNLKNLLEDMSNYIEIFDPIFYQTYVACFCKSENLLSQ